MVIAMCGSLAAYCFYAEIYKGNYDFTYYNKGRNYVHRSNSGFFRYNIFFAGVGIYCLAMVSYVVPVFFSFLSAQINR